MKAGEGVPRKLGGNRAYEPIPSRPCLCSCQQPPAKCLALSKSLPGCRAGLPSLWWRRLGGGGTGPIISTGPPAWHQRNWICCEM